MKFEDVVRKLAREKDSNSRYVSRSRPKRPWIARKGVKVNIVDYISTTKQDSLEMIISNCTLAFNSVSNYHTSRKSEGSVPIVAGTAKIMSETLFFKAIVSESYRHKIQ